MKSIANFLFEARLLKKIARSGYPFLGSGKESVAEHSFMTALIGYVLSKMVPDVDCARLVMMCMAHDLAEARTGDMNYVQKKYVNVNETKAVSDMTKDIPFGRDISGLIDEFNKGESQEAMLARDADQLALIVELKVLKDLGNTYTNEWLSFAGKRLKTGAGLELYDYILSTSWDEWWFQKDKEDWWINGKI
ncbi:MAG: HD domain-containing protein [Pseudomonadota bacterium]